MSVLSHTVTFIVITSHKYVSLDHQENDNHRREAVHQDLGCHPSDHQECPAGILVDQLEENHPERPGGDKDEDNGGGLPTTILPA